MSATKMFTETVTALGGAATFVGQRRSAGSNVGGSGYFNVDAYANQAGVLYVERSVDNGVTWTPSNGDAGTAVALGVSVSVRVPVTAEDYRVRFTNGATPNTVICISSSFSEA